MSMDSSLQGLVIRAATVRAPDWGYIIACDIAKERDEMSHAITFKWKDGVFTAGSRGYDAHSQCLAQKPEVILVDVSAHGHYSAIATSDKASGNIFDASTPRPAKPRAHGIRSVSSVGGVAYAVGLGGMVYRLDNVRQWTRLDERLPDTFAICAMHGFSEKALYAVGKIVCE